MGIGKLNRFHWLFLGVVLGALIGYLWTGSTRTPEGMGDQAAFERDVVRKDEAGNPLITSIVIHPSRPDFRGRELTLVTYNRFSGNRWRSEHFYTRAPFIPVVRKIDTEDPHLTVGAYLVELAKQSPQWQFITYSAGWWTEPRNAAIVGAGAGLLVLGGLWPTLLNLMLAAGWGPKDRVTGESLWHVRSRPDARKIKPPELTEIDHQHLREVAEAIAKSVQLQSSAEMTLASLNERRSEPEISNLETSELEAIRQPANDEEIELRGVHYPVIIRHRRTDPHQNSKNSPAA